MFWNSFEPDKIDSLKPGVTHTKDLIVESETNPNWTMFGFNTKVVNMRDGWVQPGQSYGKFVCVHVDYPKKFIR